MSINIIAIILGLVLIAVGLGISARSSRDNISIGNRAFTLLGEIKQTFQSTGLAITGQREKTTGDWIGWAIAGVGVIVEFIGLFKH